MTAVPLHVARHVAQLSRELGRAERREEAAESLYWRERNPMRREQWRQAVEAAARLSGAIVRVVLAEQGVCCERTARRALIEARRARVDAAIAAAEVA